jgi:hypothetical protein
MNSISGSLAGRGISRRSFLVATSGAVAAGVMATGTAQAADSGPAPQGGSSDSWDSADVIFADECDDIKAAGWTVTAPQTGVYALDSDLSMGNPYNLALPPVAAGHYLLHADQTSVPGNSYLQMTHSLAVGPGAWRLDLRAKVNDIPQVYEYLYIRGLALTVTVNHYSFAYTLVEKDRLMAATAAGGVGYTRTIPVPYDNQFHDWSFTFDGVDTAMVLIDDVVISRFRNINVASTSADGIQFLGAVAAQGKSGALDIDVDSIKVRRLSTAAAVGDGSNLVGAGWQVDAAEADAYITDFSQSSGPADGMKTVAKGDVLLYGSAGAAVAPHAAHPIDVGGASWTLRFFAKFTAVSQGTSEAARGVGLTVTAGGRQHSLWFSGRDVVVRAADGEVLQTVSTALTLDATFRRMVVGVDGHQRLFVELNGTKLIDGGTDLSSDVDGPDQLSLVVDTRDGAQGGTEVYLNKLEMARSVATEWFEPAVQAGLLPDSDSAAASCVVSLIDADPLDLASGALSVNVVLSKDDGTGRPGDQLRTATVPVTDSANHLSLDPDGYHGEVHLAATLLRGAEVVFESTTRYALPASAEIVDPGNSINAQPGQSAVFADVDACTAASGGPLSAGWALGTYSFDGTSDGGVFLDSGDTAQTLTVPIELHGWFAVYVGFVSGTEALTFAVAGAEETLSIDGATAFNAATAFGPRATGEVFATTRNFAGESLGLGRAAGKKARIAYLRVVGLDPDQVTVASKATEDNTHRVIYNNDGTSPFATATPDAESLEKKAIDQYADADVEAVTFQSGTTFFFNYTSEVAGVPYASLTPAQEGLMRDVDKAIKQSIDGFTARGEIPAEILAARGTELGIDVYSGLRMDAVYLETQYPWYDGNHFDVFKNYLSAYFNGATNLNYISYFYPEVQDYLKQALVEQSQFANIAGVDLDFCRYPNVLGYEKGLVDAYANACGADARQEVTPEGTARWENFRAGYINQFMRDLRAALGATKVIARIPVSNTLAYGLDIQTWIDERLIDVLVPSAVSSETFWPEVGQYTAMTAGTPIKVYGGTTGTLGGSDITKADEASIGRGFPSATGTTSMTALMYQERASEFYQAGYDGMYLFNYPSGAVTIGKLGDRVANEKWRAFELPAIWVQDFATAQPVAPATLEDLDRQLSQSRAAGAISDGEWSRLDAQVRAARQMVARGSRVRAAAAIEQFVAELRRCRDHGDCSSSTAGSLIATARVAMAG